ncbi:thiamine pyrophosphokinase [Fusarium sporotrichioides]|jgi:8-oxo-dGTP pyrophosphatase MutT (NUDIX family)|uniref:Thiamine pyrophosphokinase n=1 Tax=Fusarium sporotrichioides TaxID=5514 RepID=A0A395SEI1_FUSSP|nr:thiamine pyrophosphokinase [Fusarium sporotrichioides]
MPSTTTAPTTRRVVANETLYTSIAYANKYEWRQPADDVRRLFIDGVDELVGLVPENFAAAMIWDPELFSLPPPAFEGCSHRIIIIRTDFLPWQGGLPGTRTISDTIKCSMIAFEKLASDNSRIFPSLAHWSALNWEKREYSLLHLFHSQLRTISIPTPLRGFLGILTVGVHLNVYSRDRTTGDFRIWVAKRAIGRDLSYSGMLDQVVAGGVDPEDRIHEWLAPFKTLTREAKEETGLEVDKLTLNVFAPGTDTEPRRFIGTASRVSCVTFFDKKDWRAGELNEDQLEPGVRIIYDLEIMNDYCPQGNEPGIEKIMSMDPLQVRQSLLEEGRWKPNCGLVMLDFLVRHQIVNLQNDSHYDYIMRALRPELPFPFAHRWNECRAGW